MSMSGIIELLRRAVTVALATAAFIWIPRSGLAALLLALAALAAYALVPRRARPEGAFIYERMPSVVMPDLLGVLLTAFFVALPFWAGGPDDGGFGPIHPMAFLLWPMALFGLAILVIAARYAVYWLAIAPDGLRLNDLSGEQFVPFSDIALVEPYRRGLPGWMRALVPLLIASGRFTQAGAIMVARDSSGVRLRLADGSAPVILRESFEKPYAKVLAALEAHHIPFGPDAAPAPHSRSCSRSS